MYNNTVEPNATTAPARPRRCPRTRALERRFYSLMTLDRYLWRGRHSESPRFAAKQATVAALHRVSGLSTPRAPAPVPELDVAELTVPRFLARTDQLRRVCVIRGFARGRLGDRWSEARLRARLAGRDCAVIRYRPETFERGWDVGAALERVDFGEFLDRMKREPLYLNNSAELLAACPELVDALELGRVRRRFLPGGDAGWDELLSTNLFVGGRQVFTAVHCAMGGNFFLQLAGRKRWTLVDPDWSAWLHPVNGRPFQYCNSAFGGYRAGERLGLGDRNPLLRVPRLEVVLEPGDLLYNAPWWWHEVENLDDYTVACAVRHAPAPFQPSPSWRNHRLFSLTSTYPAMRALALAHYARWRVTGHDAPLREVVNKLLVRLLYKSLERHRARRP